MIAPSPPSPPGSRGRNPLRLFRNPAFARLFSAEATSVSGSTIGQVALTWLVLVETNSAIDIALLGVVGVTAAAAFSLVAGTIVDRQERRRLMILADLVRAGALAGLLIDYVAFGFHLGVVLACSFLLGAFTTLFFPAERAFLPSVVPPEDLSDANGLALTSGSILTFAATGIAGVLIGTVRLSGSIAVNVATFLVSAALIFSLRSVTASSKAALPAAPAESRTFLQDTAEGLRYLGASAQRGLLWLTVSAGTANFFVIMVLQFLVLYSTRTLAGGPTLFGLLLGAFSLGFAPGALMVGRFRAERFVGRVWILGTGAAGFALVGLVVLPTAPAAFLFLLGLGAIFGFTNTAWLTAVQRIVPSSMQGRYFGIDQLGSIAIIPAGQLVGGLLIAGHGVLWTFGVAAVGYVIASIVFGTPRSLWRLTTPDADAGHPRTGP